MTYRVTFTTEGGSRHHITVCLPHRFDKAGDRQCHRAVAASCARAGEHGLAEIRQLGAGNVVLRYGFLAVP